MFLVGGSDYLVIKREVITASKMPDGRVTTNLTVFEDSKVELEQYFFMIGRAVESGMTTDGTVIPVVFDSQLTVFIPTNDGIDFWPLVQACTQLELK